MSNNNNDDAFKLYCLPIQIKEISLDKYGTEYANKYENDVLNLIFE